jgi:hypothetical protein
MQCLIMPGTRPLRQWDERSSTGLYGTEYSIESMDREITFLDVGLHPRPGITRVGQNLLALSSFD